MHSISSSPSSDTVSITTFCSGLLLSICPSASRPFITGISKSSSTKSGRNCSTSLTPLSPSAASPMTS